MERVLVPAVMFLGVAAAAEAQQPAVLVQPAEHGVALSVNAPAQSGAAYWRVEGSQDFAPWTRLGALETIGGTGVFAVADSTNAPGQSWIFRVVSDSSVSNVLHLPPSPIPYSQIVLPPHLQAPQELAADNTPSNNPVTDAGATLGRVLFYDRKLSLNYTISCSSCHQQSRGFSDPSTFSTGFVGGLTTRNAMGLNNEKFYARGHFFWDERANTLEDQTLQPIQNSIEMGMTLTGLVTRLQGYTYYAELFTAAFGDATITTDRISRALAQFVRSMLTFRSKFDVGVAAGFTNFTPLELQGQQIFAGPRGNCAACHSGPNFVGTRIENNGLEFPFGDLGVGGVTGVPADLGKFKMGSLRNIEMTAPYMHDGRFKTLEDVIDHYSTGVVDNVNLGPALRQPGPPGQPPVVRQPNFTPQEKAALVAFLKTLTDPAYLTDPKYADPF